MAAQHSCSHQQQPRPGWQAMPTFAAPTAAAAPFAPNSSRPKCLASVLLQVERGIGMDRNMRRGPTDYYGLLVVFIIWLDVSKQVKIEPT
jgi:hypothetical protein